MRTLLHIHVYNSQYGTSIAENYLTFADEKPLKILISYKCLNKHYLLSVFENFH